MTHIAQVDMPTGGPSPSRLQVSLPGGQAGQPGHIAVHPDAPLCQLQACTILWLSAVLPREALQQGHGSSMAVRVWAIANHS